MEPHSLLEQFSNVADRRMEDAFHDGFFSLERELRALLFDSNLLEHIAEGELRAIAQRASHESPTWEPHCIVLTSGRQWQLRVGLYQRSSEFLYTMPKHMMVAVLGRRPLVAEFHASPLPADDDCVLPAIAIDPSTRRRRAFQPGEIAVVDSRRDIFDVVIDAPVLVAKLTSATHRALQWAFSRDTLRATQAIAASPVDSELVSLSKALGAMSRPVATQALIALADHPRHFVRWAALQALGNVAPEAVIPLLDRATRDPHPHVRNAANKALAHLR